MGNNTPRVKSKSIWRDSYYALIIFLILVFILSILNGGLLRNLNIILISLSLLVATTILFVVIFSQFALPVKNFRQRVLAFMRIFSYLIGRHGPAIFIENGKLRERKDGRLRKGPGVILLDTASAAVLRTPVKFTGAVGPGITFLSDQESIAGAIDLHVQSHKIGPRENENPFLEQQPDESDAAFLSRQNRRHETQAITRDGIEVCTNIMVEFKLDSSQGMGNSVFGYNPQAVERAVIGLSVDIRKPEDNPERIADWKWLPTNIAVDLWREYLAKITIDELFPLSKDAPNRKNIILNQILQQLTQPNYYLVDDYGQIVNQTNFSKEYDLLKKRGIKVISVRITDFKFPKPVEDHLQERWQTTWLDYAKKESVLIRQNQAIQSIAGKNQAIMDYAYGTTRELGAVSSDIKMDGDEILSHLLKGNLDIARIDPSLASILDEEYSDITQLIEWVNRSNYEK